jgi:hypothetical protein
MVSGSVSVGTGLPLSIQVGDLPDRNTSHAGIDIPHDVSLHHRLRIEQFKMRVSDALAFHYPGNGSSSSSTALGRLTVYHLLDNDIAELERSIQEDENGKSIQTIPIHSIDSTLT